MLGSVMTFGRAGRRDRPPQRLRRPAAFGAATRPGSAPGAGPGRSAHAPGLRGGGRLRRGRRRAGRRAAARAGLAGAPERRAARLGGARRAPRELAGGVLTRRRPDLLRLRLGAGSDRPRRSGAVCLAGARCPARRAPALVAPLPRRGVLLRLRRPHRAGARRDRDAGADRRSPGHGLAHLRAGARGAGGPGRRRRGAAAAGRPRAGAGTRGRALRPRVADGAPPPGAPSVPGGRSAGPGGCGRRRRGRRRRAGDAAGGRRRARRGRAGGGRDRGADDSGRGR